MASTNVTAYPFSFESLFAGSSELVTDRRVIAGSQGVLPVGTALGISSLSIGTITHGTNTGGGTLTTATLAAFAKAGNYTLKCTVSGGGSPTSTFAVFDPKGVRLSDATQGTAYTDNLNFTVGGATAAAVGDTFTIPVLYGVPLGVTSIVAGTNTGGSTLTSATVTPGAELGAYLLTCVSVAAGVGTFEITAPDGSLLPTEAVQGTAYVGPINFTLGGAAAVVGDSWTINVNDGSLKLTVCNQSAVDGSQTLYAILGDYSVDTTSGDVYAAVYLAGKFNGPYLTFGSGDSWTNHVNDSPRLYLTTIHP